MTSTFKRLDGETSSDHRRRLIDEACALVIALTASAEQGGDDAVVHLADSLGDVLDAYLMARDEDDEEEDCDP